MPQKPNKLARFWQELKRRRVIHVITVYASASFVIIELINNLAEPLNLPDTLPIIVIIILAVGFPLAVILSWIYDFTSKGVEKTKPLDETLQEEKPAVPTAWKFATYVSFAVILGLVTYNIVKGTGGLRPGDIQSLAILPFNNFTGDEQLDWAAAGMQSSLIGDMGKVSGLRVPGITTSNAYRDTDLTATAIAEELNVDVLVEGTLTCYGDMVCIQFRAISTYPEEKQLWVEDYMVDKSEILNLYSRIIQKMAHEMKINLTPQGETWLAETRRVVPEAYDAYLQGRILLDQFNQPSFLAAVDSFQKAIALEPDWASPYAGISEVRAYQRQEGIGSESEIIMMYENLNKALELDPNSAEAHLANAVIAAWTEFDWGKAEKEFLKAIELNPSFERSHSFYAHLLTILRRTDEAIYHGKRALELDPENPFAVGLYVRVLLQNNKCQEAINFITEVLSIDPDHSFLQGMLTDAYKCSGDYDKAFEYWKKGQYKIWEKYGVTELLEKTYYEQGWIAFIRELRKINEGVMAEFIGNSLPGVLSVRDFELGEYDKFIDWLEMWYENDPKNPNWPYFFTKGFYDKMNGYPRYQALLEKFNLPLSDE